MEFILNNNIISGDDAHIISVKALECEMQSCLAVGTTRLGEVDFGGHDSIFDVLDVDMHYNLYKLSCANYEEQLNNTKLFMEIFAEDDAQLVSTALFYGTTNVVHASKNGLRILGPGEGKRALLMGKYRPFDRVQQLHADGIICEPDCGLVPVTYSADCVTGVISAPNGAYGTFHSMAKKLADRKDNIIQKMVSEFYNLFGVQAEDLQLAIFPSASPEVYEVDEDFASQFEERFVIREGDKKPRLKLEDMAISIATQLGITQIAVTGKTTAWIGLESLRGCEHSEMADGKVGNANAQNLVFAFPNLQES